MLIRFFPKELRDNEDNKNKICDELKSIDTLESIKNYLTELSITNKEYSQSKNYNDYNDSLLESNLGIVYEEKTLSKEKGSAKKARAHL